MRRWNGWGDENNNFPLRKNGLKYIISKIGKGIVLADANLADVLAQVPPSRMPSHALINTDAETRVRHARGQSLPDWYAMRSGEFKVFPDGVAEPKNSHQVQELLQWAMQNNIQVIPYGGGTSVAGHITPQASSQPILTLSLARMNMLLSLDKTSQIARFGAGTAGPEVEKQLAEHGFLLGHFPQSFELSTVGGWVASRSSGQQSIRYGRIEQMFAGGRIETPRGTLDIPTIPASSAGPDMREIFMGTEGRVGIITEVDVRVQRLPEHESFHCAFLPDWDAAVNLVRELIQNKVQLSLLRLSNPEETRTHLLLGADALAVKWLNRYAALRGSPDGKCMLTFGTSGTNTQTKFALNETKRYIKQAGGMYAGTYMGKKWEHSRFRSPYLRHGFWEHGYSIDTMETSVNWNNVTATMQAIEQAIQANAGEGEKVHVFSHLSHVYGQGSSIYTTYFFRNSPNYAQSLARWQAIKKAGSDTVIKMGGTISHQHGVGRDHMPWLPLEKGTLAMQALGQVVEFFDQKQLMNPGCLADFNSLNSGTKNTKQTITK